MTEEGNKANKLTFKTSFCEFSVEIVHPREGLTLVNVGDGFPDIQKMSNDRFYQFVECCSVIEDNIPPCDSYVVKWPKLKGQAVARQIVVASQKRSKEIETAKRQLLIEP